MSADTKTHHASIQAGSLINILGVVYVHQKTSDDGDIYLTRFGYPYSKNLKIENWYQKSWFEKHRVRLQGTSSVYRVPTKPVNEQSIDLVVKNSRVGEDVPLETKTILDFLNAEFNSPWEEFALVMELRDGKYGSQKIIHTQEPLAIYVPPGKMQTWQSGRSVDKINRIMAQHPGIDIDILKQYKLIYQWIDGKDIVELFNYAPINPEAVDKYLKDATCKVNSDLESKGYVIADMKPAHIILSDSQIQTIIREQYSDDGSYTKPLPDSIIDLVFKGEYSVVDYELLSRTKTHEERISEARRHSYHNNQIHRFTPTEIPGHLESVEILGLPYIHGHVESTGGQLWVVGKNATLFDYFLPERWRKTHAWRLSSNNDIYYTETKDHIHLVWKISRVGEKPDFDVQNPLSADIISYGYNSPFEEFSIAHQLSTHGIPTVYIRAIYRTGSIKQESNSDLSRFQSHSTLLDSKNRKILCENHYYITIRGFYNGPDDYVAQQRCSLCRP